MRALPSSSFRLPRIAAGLLALGAFLALGQRPARAAQSFVARSDRTQVPLDDSFIFEITLSIESGDARGYRSPGFKDFRVLGEQPSQSQQISMSAGGTFNTTVFSWRYELAPTKVGTFTINPARVVVEGRALSTSPVTITVGPALGRQRPAPRGRPAFPPGLFGGNPFGGAPRQQAAPPVQSDGANFLRVLPSKTRAFVGEQITVEWALYLTQRQDKFQPVKEPRTDGFWVEELPAPNNGRGLQLTPQTFEGQSYLAAPLFRKALFPLRAGQLTITPLEAEIAQVDFFGTSVRSEKLVSAVTIIDVQPLPTAGRPADFDPAAVGRFSLAASVDRDTVAVGDAVTLTIRYSGQGNLRKLATPSLPRLAGWKTYEPKINAQVSPSGDIIGGEKTIEILLLPEQPGVTTIPSFELGFFDPAARAYNRVKSEPIMLTVTGGAGGSVVATPAGGAAGAGVAGAPATNASPENLLMAEPRPIRARGLRRSLGATFHRSPFFGALVILPPLALFGALAAGRIRDRFGKHTDRGKSRQLRRQVQQRLRAAERHRGAGEKAAMFIEIDRVLRELLSARLGRPVAGMSRDELRTTVAAAGIDEAGCTDLLAAVEQCDQARFSPGSVDDAAMTTALERASALIERIERIKPPSGSVG